MADNEPKENKYKYWKRRTKDQALNLFSIAKNKYYNKYYNLWMSKFKWRGLDEDLKEQEENYIMRKLWSEGSLALRNIKNTDMIIAKTNCALYFERENEYKLSKMAWNDVFNYLFCMINSSFAYWYWRLFDGGITYSRSLLINMRNMMKFVLLRILLLKESSLVHFPMTVILLPLS